MKGASHSGHVLEPGTLIDHYRVVRQVGSGGMGEVYLARDTKLGRKVALKLVRTEALGDAQAVERFLHEARTTAKFSHPNIVTVYGVGEHPLGDGKSCPYVALEYLEGQTLRQRLEEQPVRPREAIRYALAIAEALAEAHRHDVLHRDLKPENVLLGRDGRVRVVDFGLAKLVEHDPALRPEVLESSGNATGFVDAFVSQGGRVGTPAYMAPEQWIGGELGPAVDMWGLGLVLYQLLSGRHPYAEYLVDRSKAYLLITRVAGDEPIPPLEPLEPIAPQLAELVRACLSKSPADRPSAAETVPVLRELLEGPAATPGSEQSPFRGLLPFTEQQADLFFGRDAEVARFVERLRGEPLLPVVGPSGAGKSSFVQAGVIPRLREQGRWLVLTVRPGREPFEALASRLIGAATGALGAPSTAETPSVRGGASRAGRGAARALATPGARSTRRGPDVSRGLDAGVLGADTFARLFADSPGKLGLQLQHLAEQHEASVLLFVDQLEELFALCPDEAVRGAFVEAICRAADDPEGPVRVVVTLRDDFLWRLAETELGRDALSHVTVLRSPGVEALEEILVRPLRAAGYDADDPTLVAEMVGAVKGEPAALALLQFMGELLWERRDRERRRVLRAVHDEVGGVEGALARHADEVLEGLSQDELHVTRALLLRLVTPEGTRRVLARAAVLDGLGEAAPAVLDRLLAGRLLLTRKGPSGGLVELVHESMVRGWDRLRRWLEESREEVAFLAEARAAAELWEKRGSRDDEAWHGEALEEARRSLARVTAEVPELVTRFLAAGERRAGRARRRRRLALGTALGSLALLAAAGLGVALAFAQKERQATDLKTRAEAEWQRAEHGQATALREGARAALGQGAPLEARAKVRMALEVEDSTLARVLWWRLRREPAVWRRELGVDLNDLAAAPDGRTLVTGGSDASLFLLDAETGAVRLLRGGDDQVQGLAYAPDGKLIAAGLRNGKIDLRDPESGRLVRQLVGHEGSAMLEFSPDGRRLASASEDGTARIWNVASGAQEHLVKGHEGVVMDAAWSPDGRRVVTGGLDKTVRTWDATTGAEGRVMRGHEGRVTAVAWSRDGQLIASSSADRTVRLWDADSGEPRGVLEHPDRVYSVALSPDGVVAAGGTDGSVTLWDAATGTRRRRFDAHASFVTGLGFGPDGTWLTTAGLDKTVRRWNLTVHGEAAVSRGHGAMVNALAWSADGKRLASGGNDGRVRSWEVPGGAQAEVMDTGTVVLSLALAPDGRRLATGGPDRRIRLWNVASGRQDNELVGHASTVDGLAFGPDGTSLASLSTDDTVRLWDPASGVEERVLRSSLASGALAFEPGGRALAVAGNDGTLRVLDVADGRERHAFAAHEGVVEGLAFSPDGTRLGSSGHDGAVRLWDVASGKSESVGRQHGRAYGFSFHPDGRRVATAGSDGAARIWDTRAHTALVLRGHRGECNRVGFSPDGKFLATGGDDGTVRLWDVDSGKPYWRAPLLLEPAVLTTHAGWLDLATGAPARVETASSWRKAVEERARIAAADGAAVLCIGTHDDHLEIWDRAADRRLAESSLAGLADVVALPAGCVVRVGDKVSLVDGAGQARELAVGATAIALDRGELLVAAAGEVATFDATASRTGAEAASSGVAALGRSANALVLGFADGSLELSAPSGADAPAPYFEQTPASPVTRIVAGPTGTIAVGHADGSLGLWSLENGARLDHAHLHGALVHLRLAGGKLFAATELGDHLVWELGALERDYCELVREVWLSVPLVWEDGLPARRDPPQRHRCATR